LAHEAFILSDRLNAKVLTGAASQGVLSVYLTHPFCSSKTASFSLLATLVP